MAHFGTPRQSGHHRLGHAIGVDREHPAGVLGFLPRVEGVNQIEPGPGHIDVLVRAAVSESGFHYAQALIEREPRRTRVPGQHLVLPDRRIQTELERGVPTHLTGEHPTAHRQQLLPSSEVSGRVITVDRQVTPIRRDHAAAPACPTPLEPGSPRSSLPSTPMEAGRAHRSGARVSQRHPVRAAHRLRMAASSARLHRQMVGNPQAFLHWSRAGIWARVLTLSQIARLLRRRDRSLLSETL